MVEAKGKMPWGSIAIVVITVLGAGSFFAATSSSPQPSVGMSLAYTALAGVIVRICIQKISVVIAAMLGFLVVFFVIAPSLMQH